MPKTVFAFAMETAIAACNLAQKNKKSLQCMGFTSVVLTRQFRKICSNTVGILTKIGCKKIPAKIKTKTS